MENIDIIVEFESHCKTCKHRDLEEKYDPCNECLDNPTNVNTNEPVYYEYDENKEKELKKEEEEK